MAQQKTFKDAICPECDGLLQLSQKLHIGQRLPCCRCGSTFVITDRKPLELVNANGQYPDNSHLKADRGKTKFKDVAEFSHEQLGVCKEDPLMSTASQVSMADCPECNARLRFRKPFKVGQLVACPECEETLEVTSLKPLELNWAEEDPWDYEDHDDLQYNSRHGVS